MGESKEKLPTFRGKTGSGITYSDWRFKVQAEANASGIWAYVSGASDVRPTGDAAKKYKELHAVITRSLMDDALVAVKGLEDSRQTAKQVLKVLDQKCNSQSTSSRLSESNVS